MAVQWSPGMPESSSMVGHCPSCPLTIAGGGAQSIVGNFMVYYISNLNKFIAALPETLEWFTIIFVLRVLLLNSNKHN